MSNAPFFSFMQIPKFSPHDAQVLGTDAHLPPLSESRLSPLALRDYFSHPGLPQPQAVHEPSWSGKPPKPASVLLGIVTRPEPTVLLTVRTAHLTSHSGQVALPGGRQDAQDADEIATALREAQEEVGLHPQFVSVLGCLPLYITGTGYKVTPVVGLIDPAMQLTANPHEVADVFEVPLAYLMNPANHRRHALEWQGVKRQWISMPYEAGQRERLIWGATAGMLRHLYDFLQTPN
jgi:8-oxo-dGTP pyrophosphatase MutT (NUDIX family)